MDLFPSVLLKVAEIGKRESEGACSVLPPFSSSHPLLWLSFKAQKWVGSSFLIRICLLVSLPFTVHRFMCVSRPFTFSYPVEDVHLLETFLKCGMLLLVSASAGLLGCSSFFVT